MKSDFFTKVVLAVWFLIFFGALTYYGYLAWFNPSKYKTDRVSNVKNWWPFSEYFKSLLSSSKYLWVIRITYLLVFLAFMFLLILTIFGVLRKFL
jgi:hypothetical protein